MSPLLAVVLSLLASPGGADASPASAASETQAPRPTDSPGEDPAVRAGELFRDGEFAEAAEAFELAYERTGDPALLFGRAQALRRAGNCKAAIEVFEQFIATSPPEPDVQAARDVIEACRAILGEDALAPVEPQPQPQPPPPRDAPSPEPPPSWRRDVAGGVLLGTGLGVTIAGAAVYGAAFGRARDRMETEQAYEQRQRSVRTMSGFAVGLMVTGGALLVGSVVRYAIVARRGTEPTRGPVARRAPLTWRF